MITALALTLVAQTSTVTWSEEATASDLTTGPTGQRQCIVGVVSSVWPDAAPAGFTYLHCNRKGGIGCSARETVTESASQFVADQRAGLVPDPGAVQWDGSNATYERLKTKTALTSAQVTALVGCLDSIFPSAGAPQSLTVERSGSTYPTSLDHQHTGTAAEYVAALVAGDVKGLVQ